MLAVAPPPPSDSPAAGKAEALATQCTGGDTISLMRLFHYLPYAVDLDGGRPCAVITPHCRLYT